MNEFAPRGVRSGIVALLLALASGGEARASGPHLDAQVAPVTKVGRAATAQAAGATAKVGSPATAKAGPAAPPKAGPAASAKPDPLAQRLCDALHALPAERRKQCCGVASAHLADVCAQELTASLATGSVGLDAAAIDRCAAETSRQLEGCDWVTPLTPALPDACRSLVRGQRKAGAGCRSSLECGDRLYCRGVSPSRNGVCAAPAAARNRCEVPADNLAAFARAKDDPRHPSCDGLCIRAQCLPFAAAGATCSANAQCGGGLHCLSGRCQDRPLPKLGEACDAKTSCVSGSFCESGLCVALKGEGAACSMPFECRAFACLKKPGEKAGKCGAPCGPAPRAAVRVAEPGARDRATP